MNQAEVNFQHSKSELSHIVHQTLTTPTKNEEKKKKKDEEVDLLMAAFFQLANSAKQLGLGEITKTEMLSQADQDRIKALDNMQSILSTQPKYEAPPPVQEKKTESVWDDVMNGIESILPDSWSAPVKDIVVQASMIIVGAALVAAGGWAVGAIAGASAAVGAGAVEGAGAAIEMTEVSGAVAEGAEAADGVGAAAEGAEAAEGVGAAAEGEGAGAIENIENASNQVSSKLRTAFNAVKKGYSAAKPVLKPLAHSMAINGVAQGICRAISDDKEITTNNSGKLQQLQEIQSQTNTQVNIAAQNLTNISQKESMIDSSATAGFTTASNVISNAEQCLTVKAQIVSQVSKRM